MFGNQQKDSGSARPLGTHCRSSVPPYTPIQATACHIIMSVQLLTVQTDTASLAAQPCTGKLARARSTRDVGEDVGGFGQNGLQALTRMRGGSNSAHSRKKKKRGAASSRPMLAHLVANLACSAARRAQVAAPSFPQHAAPLARCGLLEHLVRLRLTALRFRRGATNASSDALWCTSAAALLPRSQALRRTARAQPPRDPRAFLPHCERSGRSRWRATPTCSRVGGDGSSGHWAVTGRTAAGFPRCE